MTRPRRRGRTWVQVAHGIHFSAAATYPERARLESWDEALPAGCGFTAFTGAAVHGLWTPPLPPSAPVFVVARRNATFPQRSETLATRTTDPSLVDAGGLRVATVAECLLACARWLGLLDTVTMIDSALAARVTTTDEIAAVARPRRPGAQMLLRALAWADSRAESPRESVFRMAHHTFEVPVTPQFVILDDAGMFVARGDLRVDGTRHIHENDGAYHRDPRQHSEDLRRERRMRAAGWDRCGYAGQDTLIDASLLLADCDAALGRAHDPARLQRWRQIVAESLHTQSGQHTFAAKLSAHRT